MKNQTLRPLTPKGEFIKICLLLNVTLITLFLAGCSEEFLDRKPKGQLTFDTFFETPDHAIWATNAIYHQFRSWEMTSFAWIGLTDVISDDAEKGSIADDG